MDVKELLRQYRSIRKEIEEKSTLLNDHTISDSVRGSDSEFPYIQHTMQVYGVEPTMENARMQARLKTLKEQKKFVDQFIDGIEDSLTRRIFEEKYIKGMYKTKWTKVAMIIGGNNSPESVRKIHDRYLQKI